MSGHSMPLRGRRVIITRPGAQATQLSEALKKAGAQVELCSVIKPAPPPDYGPVDSAISRLAEFDWIIFTSANGVAWFLKRLRETGLDANAIARHRIAAIGPATAGALERESLTVDFVPSQFVAESVVEELPGDLAGKSILIPRALEAREIIIRGLEERGANVEAVPVYQTMQDTTYQDRLRELAATGQMDIVTFTSASTVRNFMALLGDVPVPDSATIACIGPITAQAACELGLEPEIIAEEFTADGLVEAIVSYLSGRN